MAAMANSSTTIRTVPLGKQPRNPISRKQVELVISRSVAGFGIVFGAQTVGAYLGQFSQADPVWVRVSGIIVFGSLGVVALASILNRAVRFWHGFAAVVYLIALVTWPFFAVNPSHDPGDNHWLYLLLTVATATASISFSRRVATAYLFVVPALYGVIRTTPGGGEIAWQRATLDTVYAIILGGAVMIIVTMLRQAASSVDGAQATALDRYGHAVRQHATEVERVQVDAIVHDSVLTTLLSAARAFTPEAKKLAATMAGNAIGHLRDAATVSPDDGSTVKIAAVARRIADAAVTMSSAIEVRARDVGALSMPAASAEAIYSAAVQAMVNSLQHAGNVSSVRRWVRIHPTSTGGIDVEVGDDGAGFEFTNVPSERLGVRVSIVERVANAGGLAQIDSRAGHGTVVSILWPSATANSGPEFEVGKPLGAQRSEGVSP
jgi:signal transduction histidine kinase